MNPIEIIQNEQVVLEITSAAVGPPGPKGEAIDLLPVVGDPNTDFAQLYLIFKL